ncbi:ABC transporter permease subunit [Candidatus Phytoplasma fraxini]|uniref:Amino acid ABC transporter, substrate-binding protein n=1 Tax=Ash yellows phytoplasma TaxID=35780 RepID=A0ABZ2U851_ASHYP
MSVKIYKIKKLIIKNCKKISIILNLLMILIGIHYRLYIISTPQTQKSVHFDNEIKLGIIGNVTPVTFDAVNVEEPEDKIITENGDYISGSDILLFKDLCQKLNTKLTIKIYKGLSVLLQDLESNKIQCAMSMMNITKAREEKFLAIKYFQGDTGVLVRKNDSSFNNVDSSLTFNKFKEQYLKDKKITTIQNSIFDLDGSMIPENYKKTSYPDAASCLNYLKQNEQEVFILDNLVIDTINETESNDFKKINLKKDTNEFLPPLGIFLNKSAIELKTKLEQQIEDLDVNNNYYENYCKKAIQIYKKSKTRNSFWKNLLTYEKGLYYSLLLAIYGLICGLPLALFCFKIQILSFYNSNCKLWYVILQKISSYIISGCINFCKAVPIIIQTLLIYNLLLKTQLNIFKSSLSSFYTALIIISLNTAFHLISIMVNHAKFLDKGQIEAAYALGMNQKQVFKYIIFEQTLKRIIPSLWSQFIMNFKETSLFAIIGLSSLLWSAERNAAITYNTITPFLIVSVIYLFLVCVINVLNQWIHHKKL